MAVFYSLCLSDHANQFPFNDALLWVTVIMRKSGRGRKVMSMLPEREKQQIVNLLMNEVQPAFIVLFGSYAKGTARKDSDVDLAYYSEEKLNAYNRFILAGNLAEICGTEVDVVNIRDVDTVFAM
jgi:predicted nucleotidyltransferase